MPRIPSLDAAAASIRIDAEQGLLSSWAHSTVVDEHTGGPVIEREVFDALHAAAGLAPDWPEGNAGILHVYGYWFSSVKTPFGMKRDRWVDGHLASALGLKPDAFLWRSSTPENRVTETLLEPETLLKLVTEAALPLLHEPPAHVTGTADARVGNLKTRVVLQRGPGADATALVYGIDAGDGFRLVTLFPLQGDTDAVMADFTSNPRLRWNAVDPRG
ncbi:amino acid deaminase [uncultured Agrococcus sp.]|uniref:amino acid deaminase n=1 Tax=uncultured Agrococcus sp. TaxID=382258 RepID=UPI0025DABD71|nr:amino acid deaminase [uncultured Agrococcus sp.]